MKFMESMKVSFGYFVDWLGKAKNKKIVVMIAVILVLIIGIRVFDRIKIENVKNTPKTSAVDNEKAKANANAESNNSIIEKPKILDQYQEYAEKNKDLIGWIKIPDTKIDGPVMFTKEDENFYLNKDFEKKDSQNGSFIMDSDAIVGSGTRKTDYLDGTKPSTNLIIHGHNMKSGEMFGELELYKDRVYGLQHGVIYFDSLYEEREYELIAAFFTKVYLEEEDVFKYYQFFQANTQAEFDDFYKNIKMLSIYDTGVEASYKDEFITLSTCSYQEDEGRFVVIAKRRK